jgi:hypothetical protein
MEAPNENPPQDFQMPPELARRPPRPVRRKSGMLGGCGLVFGRLFIMPHTIAGIVLLAMVPLTIAEMFFGTVQHGAIIAKWTTYSKRTNYHLRYTYVVAGRTQTAERSCSQAEYNPINPAQQPPPAIEIRGINFLGHYFHEALLPDESRFGKVALWVGMALFWNGVLSIFFYMFWIFPWLEKRLYRRGIPVPGRVFGKHTRSGKTITHYIDYEFIHPQLGMLRKQQTVQSTSYHQAHDGQLVTILCYPHRKRPSLIYEFGNFECL